MCTIHKLLKKTLFKCVLSGFLSRNEERLELRHELEGHQLGVVCVDINASGTSILCQAFVNYFACIFLDFVQQSQQQCR